MGRQWILQPLRCVVDRSRALKVGTALRAGGSARQRRRMGRAIRIMNVRGLASQAASLTAQGRAVLCLLVLWVLEPVLDIESSEPGRLAAWRARMLWEEAWDAAVSDNSPQASRAEELVASSKELNLEEEPRDPSIYRVDFLAALLYALRSYNHGSQQDLVWCLQRVSESLEFLDAEGFTLPDSMDIDGTVLRAIRSLVLDDIDATMIKELRKSFAQAHDTCKRSLQSTRT